MYNINDDERGKAMKALVYDNYGNYDQLYVKNIDKPIPKENEVLIKVHATSINKSDVFFLTGKPRVVTIDQGLRKPKKPVLGADVAGEIVAVGSGVTKFSVGDVVIADMSDDGRGGLAEYAVVPEKLLVKKPENITMNDAATYPMAGVVALQGIKKAGLKKGEKVLVYGGTGSVGLFAFQIAKAIGAIVTVVCSTKHMATVQALGADAVIDYSKETLEGIENDYDVILGVNGYQTIKTYKRCLKEGGRYVCLGGAWKQLIDSFLIAPFASDKHKKLFNMGVAKQNIEDMNFVSQLIAEGKVKPVIDKVFKLDEGADAFKMAMEGRPTGKVVIEVLQ